MRKKILTAVLLGFALCVAGYAAAAFMNTPDVVLPGEVVHGNALRSTMQLGGERLRYEETRSIDAAETQNFQNAESVPEQKFVYLNGDRDIYSFNEQGELTSFIRAEQIRGADAPAPASDLSEVDAAIAAAADKGIIVDADQVELSGSTEWGGCDVVFRMGKDPRIEDRVIVSLDADDSLYSIVVQRSGIAEMAEVDVNYFDSLFDSYCAGLEVQPSETEVRYKRYGETVTACYKLIFSTGEAGTWTDMVSFADARQQSAE